MWLECNHGRNNIRMNTLRKRLSMFMRLTSVLASVLLITIVARADPENENAFYEGVQAYRVFKFEEAADLFRIAAESGDVDAQFLLGRMHYDGNSLSVDYETAYMWFDIAAHNGLRVARRYRDGLAERMTGEEVAQGQARAQKWRLAHPVPPR